MSQVEICRVTKKSELDEFINLPWRIYADDPNWVPPLKKAVRRLLDPAKHPFWKFSEQALFLAKIGTRTVGRIAGIMDNNFNSFHNEKMGAWGFFESEDDPHVAEALFGEVEEWARSKGLPFLRGPFNPSTNYDIGLLTEGFQYPPSIMMPYNPSYYGQLVESCGFSKEKDLVAVILERNQAKSARIQRLAGRIARNKKVTIRKAERKNFDSEMALIRVIYNAAWSRNWGFVPMTDEEMLDVGKEMLQIADTDLILFTYYEDEPVGVTIVLPDIGPLLKRLNGKIGLLGIFKVLLFKHEIRSARALAMGFKKTHQGLGLPIITFDHLLKVWEKKNFDFIEIGWNLEDNYDIINLELEFGARIYKKYRIFRKDLTI
ncbi:MAG: acyl-CoA N-acyltransferase [Desulfomonilaceae bacterium]